MVRSGHLHILVLPHQRDLVAAGPLNELTDQVDQHFVGEVGDELKVPLVIQIDDPVGVALASDPVIDAPQEVQSIL
jgi:hypothetical protein